MFSQFSFHHFNFKINRLKIFPKKAESLRGGISFSFENEIFYKT